ncbi:CpaD family pilus assembly protein [Erythrobacter sp. F6033]|uniref:CpaD family pilus assembly protein n=1 Tax=Erythrobacter sp. F6033 TaxID=2926401 RepID=UPI001FF117E3|nr:CpaD family pilus assembly protein [Erythrobacter sp. F6033]MCK0129079.1 CpaD family pilus assembly protein [Erythrobacter sp. F6033]
MLIARKSKLAGALALSIGLITAGCGGVATNTSLYSTKQAVVERTNFTFDVQTNASGLPIGEQSRLNGWFEAMDLRYGDRVTIEDPANSTAVSTAVNDLAGRYGIIVSKVAPTTAGYLQPGQARVVITRSSASVPGCPDWSAKSDTNYMNANSPGYGCGVNSNLAAMIANPEDLLEGQKGTGETVIVTGTKAIDTYRETPPTGAGGLQSAQAEGGQ